MTQTRFSLAGFAAFFMLALMGLPAMAETRGPDPALTPEQVVDIQLQALKFNDNPTPNAGIAQTFALAHPSNKRVTGPLPRFEKMIRTPAYAPLLGHAAHQIERLAGDETVVRFRVFVELENGKTLQYLWEVKRVLEGPDQGAWLTTNVSAPAPGGQSI